MFNTIVESTCAELIEKKSKFLAEVMYVESEKEAQEKIKLIQKKYFDAKHHCFAYRIYEKSGIIERFSDNGEPSGTAGAPILNLLVAKKICNVLIVVTRYFGGILLGTGGLVRAYTGAASNALNKAKLENKDFGFVYSIDIGYSELEKCKFFFQSNDIRIERIEFLEKIRIFFEVEKNKVNIFDTKYNLGFDFENLKFVEEKIISKKTP